MKSTILKFDKTLFVLCLATFLVPFMGSALNLAMPKIGEYFSMNAVTLTWIATIYLISTAIFQIPLARIADLIGRKKIFLVGILIFSASTFLCGFAPSAEILICLRFFAGIGSAMMFGTNMAILTAIYPANQRGRILGINVAVVYFSLASGPFLGGMLAHFFGWKGLFFVCGGIGFIVFSLSKLFLKGEWIEAKGEKFDIIGSIIFGIGLFGLIYGFSNLSNLFGIFCAIFGIIAAIFFVIYEKKQEFPVLNIQLFSENRLFSLSCLAALINYAATSAIAFMISLYLQYIRGFDAKTAGFIMISQALVQAFVSLLAGKLSDKFAPSKLATSGMLLISIGLFGLIFLSPETPIWQLICLLALLGFGFGIFSSPNMNVIMSSVDKKYLGQAAATTGTARLTGQAFSLGIAGMAISFCIGGNAITPEFYPAFMKSMQITFSVFATLCLFGIYASNARIEKGKI